MHTLIEIDRNLLVFFNGSDSLFLDNLVVTLTSGLTWIPLYLSLLYIVKRKYICGWILMVALFSERYGYIKVIVITG